MHGPNRPLLVGILIALAGAILFAGIAFFALRPSFLTDFDRAVAEHMVARTDDHEFRRGVMLTLTFLGDIAPMTLLAAVLGTWQFFRGRRLVGLACWLVPLGGALVNLALKTSFDRERPPAAWRDLAVEETNESFPSGHAMGSAIGYGMVAYLLILTMPGRRIRILAPMLAALLAAGIGFSRIYLRAHWFSDVLAGLTIGVAWLAFCLGMVEGRRRATPATEGDSGAATVTTNPS